ncbi:MAG TPA: SusC/RagA family TonB-linked outer membrane protein [Gemmatimonadaceae bacterium]|nr:SusC/RagA family TonB-linked outer membrane protein [Gemmatimonadaceae bacterium]
MHLRCERWVVLFAALLPSALAAQSGTVRGRVTDASSGQPVANVQIVINGTSLGTLTSEVGAYSITAVPAGSQTIVARRIGFTESRQQITVTAGQTSTVDFTMSATATTLSDVIVTGVAAPTVRRAVGNSVESVAGEEVNEAAAATAIDQALQGKVTGAIITENSGQPGGGVSVRLRGTNSILGGAEPLYVVDGVIIDNNSEALVNLGGNATRGGAALSNRLADLDPADVERIEVLKGAAAAALYGSKANNGVIQIFTKRGRAGAPSFNASTQVGSSETPERYKLNMSPTATFADVAAGLAPSVGAPVERFDPQSRIFRTGISTTQRLSVSGGTGGTQYYFAGSYEDEQGIVETSDYNRLNLRANIGQQLNDKLDITVRGNFIKSEAQFVTEGEQSNGVLTSVVFTPTTWNPYKDPATGRYPYNPILGPNPLLILEQFKAPENVTRFVGGFEAQFRPFSNFSVRYLAGVDDYRREVLFLQPPLSINANFTGSVQAPVQFTRQFNNDILANLEWSLSPSIGMSTGGGIRYTSAKNEVLRAAASDLPPDQGLVGGATQSASQSRSELRTFGGYLEQRISVNDRLYLTGGVNFDASSAFGEDQRLQIFPRVSASWVMNEEPAFSGMFSGPVSSFRLRAAFGETGGQPPGAYSRLDNYVNTSFAGRPGLVASNIIGNPDLKPERQREFEFGFDMGMFDDRAQFEATYYDKFTSDLVLSVPVAPSTGATVQFQNVGELTNKGVELALNTVNINRPNFTWRSRLTWAANRNEVTKLAASGDSLLFGYLNYVMEGQPVGVFYGGIYARNPDGTIHYAKVTADSLLLPVRGRDTTAAGGTVNAARIIGDPNPDFTMSFSNTIDLPAGFQVSALLDGRFGNDVANFTRRITEFFGSDAVLALEASGDTVPKTFGRNPAGRISIYEEYIEDGSFVKLREVAVSKKFETDWLQSVGAESMVLRLSGRNLYTWTDYRGLDPEVNLFSAQTVARGVDFATIPLPRTFVASLTFSF